jgi:hypothetical protein
MEHEDASARIPAEIMNHIGARPFGDILSECRSRTGSSGAFLKRMYDRFDAFFIVKFLNTFNHSHTYPPVDVREAGKTLLKYYGLGDADDLYEAVTLLDVNS